MVPSNIEVPSNPRWQSVDPSTGTYTAKTQPRDAQGRFRQVLARLKQDLGEASLDEVAQKVEHAENLDNTGDYSAASKAAGEVVDIVDRMAAGALDARITDNVKMGAQELAKAISNLPLPFKDQSQKIRYSDVPPALKKLIDDMVERVGNKFDQKTVDEVTKKIEEFKSGSRVMGQAEISSELNTLLRMLT